MGDSRVETRQLAGPGADPGAPGFSGDHEGPGLLNRGAGASLWWCVRGSHERWYFEARAGTAVHGGVSVTGRQGSRAPTVPSCGSGRACVWALAQSVFRGASVW